MKGIIIAILALITVYGLSFILTAGAFYLIIKILTYVGITSIGGLTLVFTWKLALMFWLLCLLIKFIFGNPKSSNN